MKLRHALLAGSVLLTATLGGCSSSDGVSSSVGVSYGYGYGYGAPYYPGYYGPYYGYGDVVVVPPERPGNGGDPGQLPKPLPTPPGGATTLPAGSYNRPSSLPSPAGPSAGYNSLPPPRSASAPRPTSRPAPRPAPRPTPRPMGGGGRRR
jgi:hypothetical protein